MNAIRKFILVLSLSTIGVCGFSQNNGVGLNLLYDGFSGLGAEIRYERQVYNRWIVGGSLSRSFDREVSALRLGVKYDVFKIKKLSLFAGLDYHLRMIKPFGTDGSLNYNHSIEIPLELRFQVSQKFSIIGGFTFPISLDIKDNYLQNNLRVGTIMKF